MMTVGTHRLDGLTWIEPPFDAVGLGQEHGRKRDRQEVDGERPDQVHEPGETAVHEAAEEARDQPENERDQAADSSRRDCDLEGRPSAVEHARHDIPPLGVGTDEVVRVPGGADRNLTQAELAAALLDHVDCFAADDRRPGEVGGERVRMRDVVRVDRRQQADHDDQQEEDESRESDLVAQEAPQGEAPWAPPCDFFLTRREAELVPSARTRIQPCATPYSTDA